MSDLEFKGACYACEVVAETNIKLQKRIDELEAENKKLRELVEYLLTMTVYDYDSLAIKQDAKEIYDEILKGGDDE